MSNPAATFGMIIGILSLIISGFGSLLALASLRSDIQIIFLFVCMAWFTLSCMGIVTMQEILKRDEKKGA